MRDDVLMAMFVLLICECRLSDIHLTGWNKLCFVIFTHSLNGLTELDFLLANDIENEVDLLKAVKQPHDGATREDK
jgi:hypothetical protein